MKIKNYLLKSHEEEPSDKTLIVFVPEGSLLRRVGILPDGIYLWYEIPEMQMVGANRPDKYIILGANASIPPNGEYIDILEHYILFPLKEGETQQQNGLLIYPIYKIK